MRAGADLSRSYGLALANTDRSSPKMDGEICGTRPRRMEHSMASDLATSVRADVICPGGNRAHLGRYEHSATLLVRRRGDPCGNVSDPLKLRTKKESTVTPNPLST